MNVIVLDYSNSTITNVIIDDNTLDDADIEDILYNELGFKESTCSWMSCEYLIINTIEYNN